MTTACFTSISFSYLNRSRVLGKTLKKNHPDWHLILCISDAPPPLFNFDPSNEPWDEIFFTNNLAIKNINQWMFKHDVVELCTAVKGPVLEMLTEREYEKIVYLDPDIALINNLSPLVDLLDKFSIVLTPHQVDTDNDHLSIMDNEVSSLIHGTYNLGFIAIRNDEMGKACARWWSHRCSNYCYDDKASGLFVDQKWCDLIPAFFENVKILRDPGYNVASWNLNRRKVIADGDGQYIVNDKFLLRFYHFTKLGPVGDAMTRRYAGDNTEIYEIWSWYKRSIDAATDPGIPDRYWHFANYSSGNPIPKAAREKYRYRGDLHEAFPDPFNSTDGGYEKWFIHEGHK